jgi:anti-sigma factor RsiW
MMFDRAQRRGKKHIAQERLSAYLDGQVSPRERRRVEQHLRACAECSRGLEVLRYTTQLLSATPRVIVPKAFTLSEAEVGHTILRGRAQRLSLYLQGAAAVVAALLVVVVVGDVLTVPGRYEAPAAMVAEKAVVETVVVEAEVVSHAAPETAEAPRMEKRALETVVGEAVVEKPAAAEMQALAVTPEDEVRPAVGAGHAELEQPVSAAAPKIEAVQAEEKQREGAQLAERLEASDTAIADPTPEEPGTAVPAVPLAAATPQPTAVPQPTAAQQPTAAPAPAQEPVRRIAQPSASWWTLPRIAEATLGGLLAILLGLVLWLRRRL